MCDQSYNIINSHDCASFLKEELGRTRESLSVTEENLNVTINELENSLKEKEVLTDRIKQLESRL